MSTFSKRAKQIQLKWLRKHRRLAPFDFANIALPVIRNMAHPPLMLEDLIAVQPMQGPAGEVMYMDIVYGPPRPIPPGAIVEGDRRENREADIRAILLENQKRLDRIIFGAAKEVLGL